MSKNETSFGVPPSVKQQVLKVLPEKAEELIREQLAKGYKIIDQLHLAVNQVLLYGVAAKLNKWDKYNVSLLETIFTTTLFARKYETCTPSIDSINIKPDTESQSKIAQWFLEKSNELEAITERLPLFAVAHKFASPKLEIVPQSVSAKQEVAKSVGSKVFIVHGHDEAAKEKVTRFLEKLDLEAVILHEQPDKGKTIIEKLETHSSDVDIGYAVVLLTPDDLGALAIEKNKLSPRARQNVVFELGYFLAKLGRERVHALYQGEIELPSDYQGVIYTPLDPHEAWKAKLAKELKAVGFKIDLNKLAT
jgi:predicted nucleotide-binding protein